MRRRSYEISRIFARWTAELLALCCVGLLASCTTHTSERLDSDGSFGKLVFPPSEQATRPEGSFPSRDFVARAEPGMRKAHLLRWFGPPHFSEGLIDVREWDYIFHFHSGGGITTCRYKVIFDASYVARSFHWQPKDCGDWLMAKMPSQTRGQAAP